MSDIEKQVNENGWGVALGCLVAAFLWAAMSLALRPYLAIYVPLQVIYLFVVGTVVGLLAPRWQWACYLATYVGLLAIYLANENITANSTAGLGPFLMLPIVCLVMFAGGAFGIYLGQKRRP